MIVFLNLSSIVLGLFAWIIPAVNLIRYREHPHRDWVTLSIMSISASAISLCLQIFKINYRVQFEDWSALMDTMSAVAFVSATLITITIILNTIALIVYRNRTVK